MENRFVRGNNAGTVCRRYERNSFENDVIIISFQIELITFVNFNVLLLSIIIRFRIS